MHETEARGCCYCTLGCGFKRCHLERNVVPAGRLDIGWFARFRAMIQHAHYAPRVEIPDREIARALVGLSPDRDRRTPTSGVLALNVVGAHPSVWRRLNPTSERTSAMGSACASQGSKVP